MRKFYLFFTFAAMLCGVSCTKEVANLDENPAIKVSDAPVTFSANFESETKAYDADGKVTWAVDDIIWIGTDVSGFVMGQEAQGGAAKVVLTAENISADGKTATFTVTGLAAGATKYYAATTNYANLLYSMWQGGAYKTNNHVGGNNTKNVHLALANCDASDSPSLSFKPAGCILKWSNKLGTPQIKAIKITGSNGEYASQTCAVSLDGDGSVKASNYGNTNQYYTSQNYSTGYCYCFLSPGIVFEKGLTITAYKGTDVSKEEDIIGTIDTKKSFTTKAGAMYDLGELGSKFGTITNYDLWQAGEDFVIGGKTYNKATNGAGKLLTASDPVATAIDAANVYFIPSDLEGVALYRARNSVIIGNSTSAKSKIAVTDVNGAYNGAATDIAFYNVDFTANQALGTKTFNVGGTLSARFEDCKVTVKGPVYTSSNALGDIVFNDCDIFCDFASSENSAQSQLFTVSAAQTCGTFKMNNCVVWCSQAPSKGIAFLIANSSTFSDIAVTKTTMVNCWNNAGTSYLFGASNTSALTISGNLIYMPEYRIDFLKLPGATTNPGTITGNMTYAGSGKFLEYNGTSSTVWFAGGGNSTYSENPFSEYDFATGKFVKKDTYASYGAIR